MFSYFSSKKEFTCCNLVHNYDVADRDPGWQLRAECAFGHESCVDLLGDNYVRENANLCDYKDRTALNFAVRINSTTIVSKLLKNGADPCNEKQPAILNALDLTFNAMFNLILDNCQSPNLEKLMAENQRIQTPQVKNKIIEIKKNISRLEEQKKKEADEIKKFEEDNAEKEKEKEKEDIKEKEKEKEDIKDEKKKILIIKKDNKNKN